MMTTKQLREKIIEAIKELNANPCVETLVTVESMIESYSDWYKDDNGFRPRRDIGYFRSLYNEKAQELVNDCDELDWETIIRYMYSKN